MSQLTNFYDRFFIISLLSRADKQAEMVLELKATRLSLTRPGIELSPVLHPNADMGAVSVREFCLVGHSGLQRTLRSDIHDLRWYDSTPLVREAVAGLRLLKNALIRR